MVSSTSDCCVYGLSLRITWMACFYRFCNDGLNDSSQFCDSNDQQEIPGSFLFFNLFSPSISLPLSSYLFLLCVFLFPCVRFPLFIFIYMIFYLHIAIQHFYSCTVGVVVVTFNCSTVGATLFISTCHLTS